MSRRAGKYFLDGFGRQFESGFANAYSQAERIRARREAEAREDKLREEALQYHRDQTTEQRSYDELQQTQAQLGRSAAQRAVERRQRQLDAVSEEERKATEKHRRATEGIGWAGTPKAKAKVGLTDDLARYKLQQKGLLPAGASNDSFARQQALARFRNMSTSLRTQLTPFAGTPGAVELQRRMDAIDAAISAGQPITEAAADAAAVAFSSIFTDVDADRARDILFGSVPPDLIIKGQ